MSLGETDHTATSGRAHPSLPKPPNEKDKLPGPPATPSCRAKPGWRPRSASSAGSLLPRAVAQESQRSNSPIFYCNRSAIIEARHVLLLNLGLFRVGDPNAQVMGRVLDGRKLRQLESIR